MLDETMIEATVSLICMLYSLDAATEKALCHLVLSLVLGNIRCNWFRALA